MVLEDYDFIGEGKARTPMAALESAGGNGKMFRLLCAHGKLYKLKR